MPLWVLAAFSWSVSFYFLLGFAANVGFPPDRSLASGDAAYLFLWLFFLFLPFFNKVKLGKFLELERELTKTKTEMESFKADVRNNISLLTTNVNTIGNLSNQVTVNLPGIGELEELKQKVDDLATPKAKQEAENIRADILFESEDSVMALARTRIKMEYLLRRILGKRATVNKLRNKSGKVFGLRQMFDVFVSEKPQYQFLTKPFMYVNQICNAAVHAQRVSEEQANEALDLGARILAVLTYMSDEAEQQSPN